MYRHLAWLIPLCAALTLSCATAAWADYGAGQTAWKAGRYAEALKEWRRAARAGDGRAMAALGRAFAKGLGVPQDFLEAHKWLNLAAARGDAKALAERDALAKEMTVEERAKARKLLRAWRTAGKRRSTAIVPRRRTPSTPRPPRRVARKGSPGNAALRAVAAGNISALEKALAAKADPNARGGKRGWTPLMFAADKGYSLLVPPLLKAGAKPNLRAADGATALFIAALRGHSEIIKALMKAGADPAIKGPKGKTAEGLMAMRVARTKYGGARGLHKALRANERPAVIEALLDRGADMRVRDVVLAQGAPDFKYLYTPLHIAARYNKHPEVIALLLERGADLNEWLEYQYKRKPRKSKKETALALAARWNENPEIVKKLLDRGADVNAREDYDITPLHLATYNKNPEIAKLLLDRGADVNAKDKGGSTPLDFAVNYTAATYTRKIDSAVSYTVSHTRKKRNLEVAILLIERGIGVNGRDRHGRTPLHLAALKKNPELAKLLLERGADVNARDETGKTPLGSASINYPELAKLLLDHGADVNAKDKSGWTPLHTMALNNYPEPARLLLERGADVNARTKDGETPLQIAASRKKNYGLENHGVVKVIEDWMRRNNKTPPSSPQETDNTDNED